MNKFTLDKAGNYGEVRTVNGIKPDENGNVVTGGYDLVIRDTIQSDVHIMEVVHGSFDDVVKKIRAYIPPMVCVYRDITEYEGRINFGSFWDIKSVGISNDGRIVISDGAMNYYYVSADGTVDYIEE